jgi:hypothetical protein
VEAQAGERGPLACLELAAPWPDFAGILRFYSRVRKLPWQCRESRRDSVTT